MKGYQQLIPPGLRAIQSSGTQGRKLAELHDWLYGRPPIPARRKSSKANLPGKARIRGIELEMTPTTVLEVARRALSEGNGRPGGYQAWYVSVDQHKVAPKWLVSRLTGLPASAFGTDEALRFLARLGIRVRRA